MCSAPPQAPHEPTCSAGGSHHNRSYGSGPICTASHTIRLLLHNGTRCRCSDTTNQQLHGRKSSCEWRQWPRKPYYERCILWDGPVRSTEEWLFKHSCELSKWELHLPSYRTRRLLHVARHMQLVHRHFGYNYQCYDNHARHWQRDFLLPDLLFAIQHQC